MTETQPDPPTPVRPLPPTGSTAPLGASDEPIPAPVLSTEERLLQFARSRGVWLVATAEVTRQLLANRTQPALDLVVRSVAECAKADVASLVLKADNGEWVMRARAGEFRGYPVGYSMDTGGTLAGWIIRSAQAERIDDFGQEFGGENPFVAAIGAPILGMAGQVLGVVGVARMAGRPLFTEEDVEQLSNFTLQVGAALDLDRGRTDRETARLGAERDRIAADLRLLAVLDQEAAALGFAAEIEFAGPLRLGISDDLAEDIVAVVREGLSNVATHARAGHAQVAVSLVDEVVTVTVTDDGVGMGSPTRDSGLASLRFRAENRGGWCTVSSAAAGGTRLEWAALIPSDQ